MKLLLSLLAAGCGSVVNPAHQGPKPDAGPDTTIDTARCDPAKPFGTPTLLTGVSSGFEEIGFAVTADERIAIVERFTDAAGPATWSMLESRRASRDVPFDPPSLQTTGDLDAEPGSELGGAPSSDGLALYFARQSPNLDPPVLFVGTRTTTTTTYADVAVVVDGGTITGYAPSLSADGTRLYWIDASDVRLHSARNGGPPEAFTNEQIESAIQLSNPVLSADQLTLYYTNGAETDIFVATRPTTSAMFTTGVPVANVNSTDNDAPMAVSADGCVLYLASNRPGGAGGMDIWQAARPR